MPMSQNQSRQFAITLTREQGQLIDQEKLRLKREYGVALSANEIIQLLIEMHRLRLQVVASESSDAKWWMYKRLSEEGEDQ